VVKHSAAAVVPKRNRIFECGHTVVASKKMLASSRWERITGTTKFTRHRDGDWVQCEREMSTFKADGTLRTG
jgi:hypothetical protein